MQLSESGFAERVCTLVAQIPEGRFMTYGQVAALCGNARAARIVGGVAHFGPPNLPWHRVVNKQGGLAAGFPAGGRNLHRQLVEAEGIEVNENYTIKIKELIWWPPEVDGNK